MKPSNKNIFIRMEKSDFVYLGVFILLFLVTGILFFFSTKIIINNINKIFSPVEIKSTQTLDVEKYDTVVKKLDLNSEKNTAKIVIEPTIEESTPVNKVLDNSSVSIKIVNATKTNGVAKELSDSLSVKGFQKATTDTSTKLLPNTTIAIKDSKKEYGDEIKNIVSQKYPKAFITVNDKKSKFDVIITIGFK